MCALGSADGEQRLDCSEVVVGTQYRLGRPPHSRLALQLCPAAITRELKKNFQLVIPWELLGGMIAVDQTMLTVPVPASPLHFDFRLAAETCTTPVSMQDPISAPLA